MKKENNFGVSLTGGNQNGDRRSNDFYATTPECVHALLSVEKEHLAGLRVFEPCCGDGAISKILIDEGLDVHSSDLVDRGYGDVGIDFLETERSSYQAIITNPPFNISEKFIIHALEVHQVEYLALLLKSQYWHSKRRAALFAEHPPAVVYPMTWRPDFTGKGSPTMDCQWTVWRKSPHPTMYQPLMKP